MDLVYHERQIARMGGQHALNMLLQGHHFTKDNLVTIARELDQRERALLDDGSHQQESQNFDDSGYFSIQVITEALRRQANLHLEPLDSLKVMKFRKNPSMGQAYICHFEDHWFALRKIGTTWFVLNSRYEAPRVVSESYIELYITQLYAEGWSIYVVEGQLPSCAAEFKTKLTISHKTISALQMAFWKSFPSPHHYYHIKAPSGNGGYAYLYADNSGYLCSSPSDGLKGHFKFEKDPDGTISIYSKSKTKYLETQTSSRTSAASVTFRADVNRKSKYVLIFHPKQDKQLPGILVDILALANNCFLSADEVDQTNRFAANSPIAPSNKFLIIAEGVE